MAQGDPSSQIVLALDSSTDMLACAVARVAADGSMELLASGDHLCRRRANVELTTTALDVLARAGLSMGDVTSVLVGRGPGSFTGVRIGIATAKGLACGCGIPLHGASTLDAVAWGVWESGVRGMLAVLGDAMRGELYPGVYRLDESGAHRRFDVERVCATDVAVSELAARSDAGELLLAGDGLKKYRARFEAAGLARVADEALWHPSASGLLRSFLSPDWVPAVGDGDPALVLPVYTRLSDAEENERKRLGLAAPASVRVTGTADALAGRHLQLRPMSVNDLDAVAALEDAAYEGSDHSAWTRQMFYEELFAPQRSWWVAHDQGELVGFAGASLAGSDFELLEVVVAEGRRREGIASRLLGRVAYDGQTLNATAMTLEVAEDNAAARELYARLGFVEAGRRRGYYGPGADALLMRAELPLGADASLVADQPQPSASIRPWPIVPGERNVASRDALAKAGDLVLAIESSCDETAMAVIDSNGVVCANVVATSVDFHARFGGVVPEIASRKHVEAVVGVFEEVMAQAGAHFGCDTLAPSDLACVGVTAGPGLVGALVVGVAFAKGLCAAAGLPLTPVNHLEGHLLANLFETPDLQPPFVASLVSGGNTMLVHVRGWGDYQLLGATIDDAVGEAFDKVAKALGLGYPGGPVISKLGAQGNKKAIHFPRAMMHSHDYRFSLSGLKTAVITYIEGENKAGRPINLPDLAASFEAAVIDVQVSKAITAVGETGVSDFCVGGGVAANPALRAEYRKKLPRRGVRVTVPPMVVCGDNGAMIAVAALRNWKAGVTADLTLDADPNAKLGCWSSELAPVVGEGWPPKKAGK
ncbi:tRNA (adenosine(37)-N6)-threonylcarbamoyltransferase complex transferase subunit TsaD [Olsenella phocaeensis]|uniref:tRNA (adenosine(37)-N6)-threonylcarbamoyltransferase complex transferase subunit TsaD n=1 Tax=Olsenella phocaeensis TaxID=1852385 RepID=UPI0026DC8EC9|nr:tRNA (adenosine(37)-N6)-threonylcarbamoyltransferase complex transferase subunit TsaD [uncultured Olsenella sp.]